MRSFLEMRHISKSFGGTKALSDVSIPFQKGEVHCLVGENGAGKSTLGKIIAGVQAPDAGSIIVSDAEFGRLTPRTAREMKISMVMQELNLMNHLSIAENIFLFDNKYYRGGIVPDRRRMNNDAELLIHQFELQYFPSVTESVGRLTVAEQQIVEILHAVSRENEIIIFDEPTASLSFHEIQQLIGMIRQLRNNNLVVILVTHKFDEIFAIADTVTVLVDGRVAASRIPIHELTENTLVKLMVGRDIKKSNKSSTEFLPTSIVLSVKDLHDSAGRVNGISFDLHQGEILGIGGLVGSGRSELVETIFGIRKKKHGSVFVNGKEMKSWKPRQMIQRGIALIPEDRKIKGLCTALSISFNISLAIINLTKKFFVTENRFKESNTEIMKELNVKIASLGAKVSSLSGGNQQKILLLKWLSVYPSIIIFDEPTRGIDIATKAEIYLLIRTLAESGSSVVIVSSEMQELIAISHRILVISEGKMAGQIEAAAATEEQILRLSVQKRNNS